MTDAVATHLARGNLPEAVAELARRVAALETTTNDLRRRLEIQEHPQLAGSYDGTLITPALYEAGWSQRALAIGLGISPQALNRYVRGRSKVPRHMAERITALFVEAEATPPKWDSG